MLKTIWLGMLIAGLVLIMLSLVLMLVFNVPDLIDELSGRKAKRQAKRLRELNAGTTGLDVQDAFSSMPSGSLIQDEILVNTDEVARPISYVPESSELESDDYEEDEDEVATNLLTDDEEDSTSYMDGEDSSTKSSNSDVVNVINGVREYCNKKKFIVVLEEGSSIDDEEEI